MEIGLVRSIDIDQEMQQAYLDYAMSVIVARALPDARDGLKPVHRRILYAMFDMGLRSDSAYKKSARVVGEVLGKYHPHGDVAVYEAMARMAQDFSMRYLLVDGQGNFGSVDGDPPAAMRYTEARLASLATHMLADIHKNTVDFSDNFDGSLTEPDVLPSAIPNLLVNGATGIAVGMSTSIPPHNLGEVVDALKFMLERWESLDDISIEDLMRFIQGPDFPTGGVILPFSGEEGLTSAYGSGRGRVTVQARAHIEEMSRGRNRIIVTELPYMTNKSSLIERIAELAREGRLEGLADLRDESDRHGLRIVIEVNKTTEPAVVLQELYKSTPMRSTFGIIMLALVDGEPRLLSLKQALRVYLDHRLVVVRRRAEWELEKARQRAHLLEGLRIALQNLDEVIDLIRKAPDVETARARLMKRFKLSEIQAQAILDMPLRRLAALERKKIEEEYKEVKAQIKDLESLLKSPKKMREMVASELQVVKDEFYDRRRTQIVRLGNGSSREIPLLAMDLAPERLVWITITPGGLISQTLDENPPKSSGREAPYWLAQVNTRHTLYMVTEAGEAVGIPVHAVPENENPSEGAPIYKVSALGENEKLAALFTLPARDDRPEGWYVVTATSQGMVKKTALGELPGLTARAFTLVKVNEGDRLVSLRLTDGKADLLLATADGMAIRFSEEEVRPMGLVAAGVGGMKLQGRDELVGMELVPEGGEVLFLTSDGKAKRVSADQFPVQGRYGLGVLTWKLPRTTQLAGIAAVAAVEKKSRKTAGLPAGGERSASLASALRPSDKVTLHLEKLAPKAIRVDEAPAQTRAAAGKPVAEVKVGDRVLRITVPWTAPYLPPSSIAPGGDGAPTGEGPALPPEDGGRKRKSPKTQEDNSFRKARPAEKAAPASNGAAPKRPARGKKAETSSPAQPAKKAALQSDGALKKSAKTKKAEALKKEPATQEKLSKKVLSKLPASSGRKSAEAAPSMEDRGSKKPAAKKPSGGIKKEESSKREQTSKKST